MSGYTEKASTRLVSLNHNERRDDDFESRIESLERSLQLTNARINETQLDLKKKDMEIELLGAKLDFMKQKEGLVSAESSKIPALTSELEKTKFELNRYRLAWKNVTATQQQAIRSIQEASEIRSKLENMNLTLSMMKQQLEGSEEILKKERRDKQIALDCLQSAEKRLDEVTKELERLHAQISESVTSRNNGQEGELSLRLF